MPDKVSWANLNKFRQLANRFKTYPSNDESNDTENDFPI